MRRATLSDARMVTSLRLLATGKAFMKRRRNRPPYVYRIRESETMVKHGVAEKHSRSLSLRWKLVRMMTGVIF